MGMPLQTLSMIQEAPQDAAFYRVPMPGEPVHRCIDTRNLPTKILPTNISWLKTSGKLHPFITIMIESTLWIP